MQSPVFWKLLDVELPVFLSSYILIPGLLRSALAWGRLSAAKVEAAISPGFRSASCGLGPSQKPSSHAQGAVGTSKAQGPLCASSKLPPPCELPFPHCSP